MPRWEFWSACLACGAASSPRCLAGRRSGGDSSCPPLALFAATLCAELALLPIAANAFSRVSVAGLVLNFVAIPLMTVAQIGGMLAVGAGLLHGGAAAAIGYIAHLAAAGIVESARLVDVLPWLSQRVPSPGPVVTGCYYVGWVLWLGAARTLSLRAVGAALVAGAGAALVLGPIGAGAGTMTCGGRRAPLRVLFLDVDQADATLVQLPDGHALLVDAGGTVRGRFAVGERVVSPTLWNAGVRRLDYLALTHGDPDHIGGAMAVLEDFRPREIWEGVPVPSSVPLRQLRMAASRNRSGWRALQTGDTLRVGEVHVRIWHPRPPDWERQAVRNDDSLVLELRYKDVSIVLPGDIGAAVESTLAETIPPAPVRVVKVPAPRESNIELGGVRQGDAPRAGGRERRAVQPIRPSERGGGEPVRRCRGQSTPNW